MAIAGIERLGAADAQAGGQERPFSKAVRAGDFVFVSGQVPTKDGEIVAGNIVVQTEAATSEILGAAEKLQEIAFALREEAGDKEERDDEAADWWAVMDEDEPI